MRFFFFFFCFSFFSQAQSIRLGQVDELKVFDGLRVTIIPSDADSLVVEGKNKAFFSYKNKNGRLYLRMNLLKRLGGFNTTRIECPSPAHLWNKSMVLIVYIVQGNFS